jgi:hypothetical protein
MLTPSAHAKGLALLVQCAADLPSRLRGDATRLGQIATNLLNNAIKFTETGQVELILTCSKPTVAGVLVRLSVRDTGIGIGTEGLARLFKPFSQADTSTTRRFGGTGLGLSIAGRFVNLMGGEIGVTSTVGVGSEFWVEIPLRAADAQIPGVLQATHANCGDTKPLAAVRILVVDDNQVNLKVAQHILKRHGAVVTTSGTGADALARLRHAPNGYDIVLMDVQMPDMDGNEATHRIRFSDEAVRSRLTDRNRAPPPKTGADYLVADRYHRPRCRGVLKSPRSKSAARRAAPPFFLRFNVSRPNCAPSYACAA